MSLSCSTTTSKSPAAEMAEEKEDPPKIPQATSRRSILNIVRRQSKSMAAGIPYEDQVAAIDPELSNTEKLEKLVRLAASATVKMVQQQLTQLEKSANDDDAESKRNELMEEVCSDMRRVDYQFQGMSEMGLDVERVMGTTSKFGRVSRNKAILLGYIEELQREKDEWKNLKTERREAYNAAKAQKRAAIRGELKITVDSVSKSGAEGLLCLPQTAAQLRQRMLAKRKRLGNARLLLNAASTQLNAQMRLYNSQLDDFSSKMITLNGLMNSAEGEKKEQVLRTQCHELKGITKELLNT